MGTIANKAQISECHTFQKLHFHSKFQYIFIKYDVEYLWIKPNMSENSVDTEINDGNMKTRGPWSTNTSHVRLECYKRISLDESLLDCNNTYML